MSHDVAERGRAQRSGVAGRLRRGHAGGAIGALLGLAVLVGGAADTAAAPHAGEGRGDGAGLLGWRAPAGCPAEVAVRDRLAQALPSEVEAPHVDAEVRVGDDGRFHATVVLRGSWGETTRNLDSTTCDTLADAVVLLAAVSVSSAGVPEPPVGVPEPTPLPADLAGEPRGAVEPRGEGGRSDALDDLGPAVAREPMVASVPGSRGRSRADLAEASSRPPTPTLHGLVRVEARAGAGLLPVVDLGAAATVGLEHRWFRVELGAAAWLPRERTVAPAARVRASASALELRGCAALRPTARLVVLPCAELDVGALRGEGRGDGLVNGHVSWQPWVAMGVGPALAVRLHPLVRLWASATLVVPLLRVGLGLEGLGTDAHRMAVAAGRGAVGVEIHFPQSSR